jgi:hypothetical protein
MCQMSWKSGSLNLLEPSGPHRACYGTALPSWLYSTDSLRTIIMWQNFLLHNNLLLGGFMTECQNELQCILVITIFIMLGAHVVVASPIRRTRLGRFGRFCLISYCWNNDTSLYYTGACSGVVVKALRYKPEGRGFDSRWCHWNFSVT